MERGTRLTMKDILIPECPVCNSNSLDIFYKYNEFRLIYCLSCGVIMNEQLIHFQDNGPQSLIDETYNTDWVMMRQQYLQETFLQHASFNILLLEMFCPRKGDLLEIGSGTGEFIFMARHAGWNASGVEASPEACAFAHDTLGIALVNSLWKSGVLTREKQYDAVAFWHVLEHIADPVAFLKEMAVLLKTDGKIILSIPNRDSLTNAIHGPHSPLFMEKDHMFHYNRSNLTLLLEHAGLKPVSIFSREEYHRLESDLNTSSRNPDRGVTTSIEYKMKVMASLQAQYHGHELFCIAEKSDR